MSNIKYFCLLLLSVSLYASAVVTQKAEKGDFVQSQNFNGTLSFNEKSRLAAESDGVITKLYFDEGDYVKKGQLLLEIDTQILTANIRSTEASLKEAQFALEKAKLDFVRYEILLSKESISKQKYDEFFFQKMQLEQKVISLESTLKAQKIAQAKRSMRAPFNGYISQRTVQVGEWLKEGTQIALLINPDKIDITIHLPSSYISSVYKSQNINVTINNKNYPAKIIGALFSGDEKTRTFPLKLRLLETKERFFDGMQARIQLQKESSKDVLLISRDGVVKRFGQDVVFVVKEGKAEMSPVQTIGFKDDKAAILSEDIKEGDDIVIKGNERLFPGQEVN